MINNVLRLASMMTIRRVHRLPLPGNVLVNLGTRIHPGDVIAETAIPSDVLMLDVAKGLGISSPEVPAYLLRKSGEELRQGDIIAQCEGAFPRLVRAPVAGRFLQCHHGIVFMATGKSSIQLQSRMMGAVEAIIPEYGAVISCQGSLLQGVWGNGGIGVGALNMIESSFNSSLEESMLESLEAGQVLAAGFCFQREVLESLKERGLGGIILDSLSPKLISLVDEFPIPVIVLRGFGKFPPDTAIFELLQSRSDEYVSVNAWKTDLFEGRHPEVVIPREGGDFQQRYGFREELALGQRIRVLSGTALGQSGEVLELSEEPIQFESGLSFHSALIQLDDGESVCVPQQNLIIQ